MRFDSLDEWLDWQEDLHYSAIDLGLDRCHTVAERMGLLSPDFSVISIAGTNGKGSSAAMLDSIFRNSGYRVGTYTSPHLIRYNERILLNGVEASDASLCGAFTRIDQARGDISLTYFEFGTLAALDIFNQADIQLAILEVGLGGRLDAVNILDSDVALVCSIDLDHEHWLGHSRESIGLEKAGIFRAGKPAVCTDVNTPESVINHASTVGARLYLSGRDYGIEMLEDDWSWKTDSVELHGLPVPGRYNRTQVQNAAGILKVLDVLSGQYPVEKQVIYDSLAAFQLSGRFQVIHGETTFILDVAHNPQSAANLVDNLLEFANSGKNHIVIGMLADKDHSGILELLSRAADCWYVTSLDYEKAVTGHILAEKLHEIGQVNDVNVFDKVDEALEHAQIRAGKGDRIIVTGSFLTVGAVLEKLDI